MGKVILINEPGKIYTPAGVPVTSGTKELRKPKELVDIAKESYDQLAPEEQKKLRDQFEEKYGVDQKTRTQAQWKNLVNTYGIKNVAAKERMKESQVRSKIKGKSGVSKSKLMQPKDKDGK